VSKAALSQGLVESILHHVVEDKLDWEFCAGILTQYEETPITPQQLEKQFKEYFIKTMGIAPYTRCPKCGKLLLPRESGYGHFVGCASYPECRFMATNSKPYKSDQGEK